MVTLLNPKGTKEGNKCYQSPTKLGLMKERPPYSRYCHYQKCDTKLLVLPFGEPKQLPSAGKPKWAQRRSGWNQWRTSSRLFFNSCKFLCKVSVLEVHSTNWKLCYYFVLLWSPKEILFGTVHCGRYVFLTCLKQTCIIALFIYPSVVFFVTCNLK